MAASSAKGYKYGSIAIVNVDGEREIEARPGEKCKTFGVAALLLLAFLCIFSVSISHLNVGKTQVLQDLVHFPQNDDDENKQHFFDRQPVDHFDDTDDRIWSNRYYRSLKYFEGPGHPIFLVGGGEGALDHGMLYPFVNHVLAQKFGAAVVQIEHRFYGPYQPIPNATVQELLKYLTPHQALADMVLLTRHFKEQLGCNPDRSSPDYCPMISVGGSYPGFLSALFRLVYPDFVDIAYASSAPLLMYAQATDQYVYYDIVTDSAERASPGCANAVRATLFDIVDIVDKAPTMQQAAKKIGICSDRIPEYIQTKDMLQEAVIMLTSYAFADYNMGNYPPGPDTDMYKACQLFQNKELSTVDTMAAFFREMMAEEEAEEKGCDLVSVKCNETKLTLDGFTCFDVMSQLPDPDDPNSTLEDTAGDYQDGKMWDFQTCTHLIFFNGFSEYSMFPPQEATLQHLTDHCHDRFGVTPHPKELVDKWGFDSLTDASYILFVNGLQDMWSGGSFLWNVSETVVAINFENGAHHSDLSHQGPTDQDTPDIKMGFVQIANILQEWLHEIKQRGS